MKRKYSWRCATMGESEVTSADSSVVLCAKAAEAALTSKMYCERGATATVTGLTAPLLYSSLMVTLEVVVELKFASGERYRYRHGHRWRFWRRIPLTRAA